MMFEIGPAFVFIAIGLLLWAVGAFAKRTRTTAAYRRAETGAPDELYGATPIPIKSMLRMRRPFALHGKPDLVYRLADGTVVVREDKLSKAGLNAAIVQASVYAAILRHNPPAELRRCRVATHGWIRTGNPERGNTSFTRVTLLTDAQLRTLVDLFLALREGFNPTKTTDRRICMRRCPHHRKKCPGP